MEEDRVFSSVHSTVFKESESLEGKCDKIEGYDFNEGVNYPKLLRSMLTTGFQASNLGEAIDVVNQMVFCSPPILGFIKIKNSFFFVFFPVLGVNQ